MAEAKTNFALLVNLLGARARDICEATGADKAVVSRWMNGKLKLMPGHGWVDKVADYLLALDDRLRKPVIPNILAAYYPEESLGDAGQRQAMLIEWLATVGWCAAQHQQDTRGLAGIVLDKMTQLTVPKEEAGPAPPMKNTVVYGITGVQGSALQFLEMVTLQSTPQEMQFVCPEGLDMLTRDKKFRVLFIAALQKMLAAGHTISVVVRTDYRVSDIAEFSGPWLVAHLLGYVQSYYYDDFVGSSKDKMLVVVPGIMAGRVSETEDGQVYATIQFDKHTVTNIQAEIGEYQAKSRQRFHYQLFERPDTFLRGIQVLPDRPHYQFARLPHFCVAEEAAFAEGFCLTKEEIASLRLDFSPLITQPGIFQPDTPTRHIFCENDIEAVLLKDRHLCTELTAILGRRVYMKTQTFVDRLLLLKKLLGEHPHYEICFLREEHFKKFVMQIAAWGDAAAIGWIAGGKSTACRDYTNVNALTGFCASVWDKIPGMMKSRRTAINKIDTWLKMAEKYGYVIK